MLSCVFPWHLHQVKLLSPCFRSEQQASGVDGVSEMDSEVLAQMDEDFTQDNNPTSTTKDHTLDYTDSTHMNKTAADVPALTPSLNTKVKYFQFSGFNMEVFVLPVLFKYRFYTGICLLILPL